MTRLARAIEQVSPYQLYGLNRRSWAWKLQSGVASFIRAGRRAPNDSDKNAWFWQQDNQRPIVQDEGVYGPVNLLPGASMAAVPDTLPENLRA